MGASAVGSSRRQLQHCFSNIELFSYLWYIRLFCGSTMASGYTVSEALDHVLDHHTGEEQRGQETGSEDGLEEDVSEGEDNTEYNPD